MSSRLMVKNLPKNMREERLKAIFSAHGQVTQVRLLQRRRFAYIGYMTERAAAAAIRYLHDTYIDTSKIEVIQAMKYGDTRLPRPWSKYSEGSSAHTNSSRITSGSANGSGGGKNEVRSSSGENGMMGTTANAADAVVAPGGLQGSDKRARLAGDAARVQREQDMLRELYQVEADRSLDPELHDYMQVMGGAGKKRTWANDAATVDGDANVVAAAATRGKDKSKRAKMTIQANAAHKTKAKIEQVRSKRPGGENVTMVKQHLTFEGSEDEAEYQDIVPMQTAKGAGSDGESESSSESSESEQEQQQPEEGMTDLDWLRFKSKKSSSGGGDGDSSSGSSSSSSSSSGSESESSDSESASAGAEDASLPRLTVRLRGLPFSAVEDDVWTFLGDIPAVEVRMTQDRNGRPSGRAFVDFQSESDLERALSLNRKNLGDRYIEVTRDEGPIERDESSSGGHDKHAPPEKPPRKQYPGLGPDDEPLEESGRLFVRNLAYACTEKDLRTLFERFGPVSELHLPVDATSKRHKAIAFVTFLMPEHAVNAFAELDGESFQGRLLHLMPAKTDKRQNSGGVVTETSSYKKRLEEKRRRATNPFTWNTLFMRQDAVAEAMADSMGVEKGDIFDRDADNAAVRVAVGEAQIVAENKTFLTDNGVDLEAFSHAGAGTPRSSNVVLVKNLPYGATADELRAMFVKHGAVNRLIMPPSNTMALVEFVAGAEAKSAFRGLAYRKYKHEPLYLEWAPEGVFEVIKPDDGAHANKNSISTGKKSGVVEEQEQQDEEEAGAPVTSLFVKGLNFDTTSAVLRDYFESIGAVRTARVVTKLKDGRTVSMGYGFVEFVREKHVKEAIKRLQNTELEGHTLSLKVSTNERTNNTAGGGGGAAAARRRAGGGGTASTKVIVRNVAFEATKKDIRELFSAFGQVKSVRLPVKKFDGSHRGFAFVEFVTKKEAQHAMEAVGASTHLYGRRLVLEWAQSGESLDMMRDKASAQLRGHKTKGRIDDEARL